MANNNPIVTKQLRGTVKVTIRERDYYVHITTDADDATRRS